jgi:hypothetical protein
VKAGLFLLSPVDWLPDDHFFVHIQHLPDGVASAAAWLVSFEYGASDRTATRFEHISLPDIAELFFRLGLRQEEVKRISLNRCFQNILMLESDITLQSTFHVFLTALQRCSF